MIYGYYIKDTTIVYSSSDELEKALFDIGFKQLFAIKGKDFSIYKGESAFKIYSGKEWKSIDKS